MNSLELKYGCNPNQKPSRIFMKDGSDLPVTVLNGKPGYINFLDALNSWQLVGELKAATGLPSAASFKHVSPAGAAVGLPLSETEKRIYFVDEEGPLTPIASAYIRARGADRMSSYGDWAALSEVCDKRTAQYLKHEVSDGIIAPGYTDEALTILKQKKRGNYNIVRIDPSYKPAPVEQKDVFGITFEQGHNTSKIDENLLTNIVTKNRDLTPEAKRDMIVSLITLKYTQSNSVCYVKNGQAIGVGAGQQSRIHCTRLAGNKADTWYLRQHPKVLALPFVDDIRRANRDNVIDIYISNEHDDVLRDGEWQKWFTEKPEVLTQEEKEEWVATQTGVTLGSDAFFPFGDNIERAHKSGVSYVAEPGGSIRDDNVIETCDKYNMVMCFTGLRLFHH
ncbi:MAG: phosphoribosylaminoimidazolecarboxamide formyltransferase [Coriobacteriaceae bacterium]|jgi:phosphoribosylaminoimidazolecarboxamide formyltransferase/IMP cyclohydrolase|uniref:phosphoribosylaminoimidazolecarboxamide formyltransferase n=1 Tax=Atopobium sp. oral taxon 416 TaxID=712157 RepID=UPI000FF343D7|nr:phosphoribosylaminoimidazolecarboxamide formyltransferase [Atopobium sp. oral taxon 416]QUC03902.1 phosphoribosylaminoimidazolecarboxamide formyltransferase [Atopobium sp. oral taxon 416]RRF98092.1 MAG: phosphoribosylaminoimidazolecarboxamide formyltransferase [Coriobacteriaceae bacterium]